jgi:hypothetical protein
VWTVVHKPKCTGAHAVHYRNHEGTGPNASGYSRQHTQGQSCLSAPMIFGECFTK